MRSAEDEKIDFERRILCPDGTCVGVVGPDGRCKICGAFAGNDAISEAAAAADADTDTDTDADADADADVDADADTDAATAAADSATGSDDFDERELCPDGACIGVIGANGRCKVCGTPRST